jgi:sodium-dependent dicarboxylate transporter 2/3/5
MMVLGVVVAVVASLFAPAPWPEGRGTVRVAHDGEVVAEGALMVGAPTPRVLEGEANGDRIEVAFPKGIATDAPTQATLSVSRDGTVRQPSLDEFRLTLELADGRTELLPAVRWDEASQRLRIERRPPVNAAVVLGLLGLVVVLWVTEAVPLWVTSLCVPVVLVFTRVGTAKQALAPFFDPIIALFFGGFLMAEAMRRSGLDHRAAITIVARAGRSPVMLFATMLGVSAFLSMWMSNTAATAMLVPIAIAVTAPIGHMGYRKATVLGIAYAATVGGVGSAIGTPANPYAIRFIEEFADRPVSFVEWFAFGLPFVVLFLPLMGAYLWWRSDVTVGKEAFAKTRRVAREELDRLGPLPKGQWVVLLVFAGVVGLWLTQMVHHLNTGIIAVAGAAALALLGKLQTEDLGRISWAALLTFGGGLTLGFFMVQSGTSDWVATRLGGLTGLPPIVGVGAVALLALGLTAVASNTATAAMLIPLAIPLAGVLGVDPVLLVVVVAIASSIDFALVIGTPPTMIAYSTGLFRADRIFRMGLLLDFAGIVLLVTVVVWLWSAFGIL